MAQLFAGEKVVPFCEDNALNEEKDNKLNKALDALLKEYPLSKGWKITECFFDDCVIENCRIHLSGIAACNDRGEVVCGSAAERGESPVQRSFFELIERTSLVDFLHRKQRHCSLLDKYRKVSEKRPFDAIFFQSDQPTQWQYSKSNGIAVHSHWKQACESARLELYERHSMLCCWYGFSKPVPVTQDLNNLLPRSLGNHYEFETYSFNPSESKDGSIYMVAVFGFPKQTDTPRVYGAAARSSYDKALAAATGELLQGLGFLWGESIPDKEPEFSPTPDYHQELYLYPPKIKDLRKWLDEGHVRYCDGDKPLCDAGKTLFLDITPLQLRSKIHVVKALSNTAIPLVFGKGGPFMPRGFPQRLMVHPIS